MSDTAAQLRAAAAAGEAATCARLLQQSTGGAPVRYSRDELGRSALHLAASAGHAPVLRLLLSAAASRECDAPDGAGCTPLQRAAADGHEQPVKLLLTKGADVDRQDSVHGNSALHEASWKGYSRTVAILAAAGADLQLANAGGFTALHLCCQNGHNQSCRELLLANCDPDVQNNYGDTALHTAARYGHAGVTRILISAQCRVSEQNKNGDTALHIAAAMGRRKLTRILLEAGCDRLVKNKQREMASDIALRKDLNEILNILDVHVGPDLPDSGKGKSRKDKDKSKKDRKQRSKSKVRFDGNDKEIPNSGTQGLNKPKNWSPYGCHYYPDPEAFPSPKLDSLPPEPLKRGEQYYLDLAGNIRKGPVGVGYTCYCAPLFRHLEAKLEKDKRELQRAHVKLGQRVAGLEQKLVRNAHARHSEKVRTKETAAKNDPENVAAIAAVDRSTLTRSRSLEMLDCNTIERRRALQATRSMDELEPSPIKQPEVNRKTVKELVEQIQQKQRNASASCNNMSESSEDEADVPRKLGDGEEPPRLPPPPPSYENLRGNDGARSRMGMYSPTNSENLHYVEPIIRIREHHSSYQNFSDSELPPPLSSVTPHLGSNHFTSEASLSRLRYPVNDEELAYGKGNSAYFNVNYPQFDDDDRRKHPSIECDPYFHSAFYREDEIRYMDASPSKYNDVNARFAKLRVLDSRKITPLEARMMDSNKMFESTTRMLENARDVGDRENNDSGYSTKVYGSSKGNSPSLHGGVATSNGQIADHECLGASSLV